MLNRFIFLTSIFFFSSSSVVSSQDLTGIWRGYFITDQGENYKLEFQVLQNKSASVTGVSYSYLDVRFYGKAKMTGTYNKNTNSFRIQETRTVEVRSQTGLGTCIMNYNFTYERSGREEYLEGTYLGKTEDRSNPKNNGAWGDCGSGKVFLRKVNTSAFYTEPFLRNKLATKNNPVKQTPVTSQKTNAPVKRTAPPIVKKTTPKTVQPTVKKTTQPNANKNSSTAKTNSLPKPRQDSIQKIAPPEVKLEPRKIIPPPEVIRTRSNELVRTINVNTNEVTLKIYDNGEIDGDTVSVYVDNELVLSKQMLTEKPLVVNLKMDNTNNQHEVVMVANNLGRIPPNTSLMVVTAGDQRYEVRITSTEQKNAVVRFIYHNPG